ncbi:dihydrofolate reductase family protein [Allokutzneria multivorans]|uniref:Dihydrofolate reductase family protein n=1 Tax=Allokutzneria multivorans TaxID=1142134 RepID=A0ABP7SF92_9PSEU
MRKLIVTNLVSVDGCHEGPGGDFMTMPLDPGFDAHNLESLQAASTLLAGANTFRLFRDFWPPVAADEGAPEVERAISRINAEIEKVVVSDSLTEEQTGAYRDTTTLVPREKAREEVAELKRGTGKNIIVFGSRTLWNDLFAAGLVDEFHLVLGPGVVGGGTPAFDSGFSARLRLLGTKTHEGSDVVVIRYAVAV